MTSEEEIQRLLKEQRQKASRLAEIVRERLKELGVTPTKAARSVGLPNGFITDILSGRKSGVQGRNFLRLAEALQLNPNDLLDFGSIKRQKGLLSDPDETIALFGEVAPGVWLDTRTVDDIDDYVPYLVIYDEWQPENLFEVHVRGTSINRIAPDGHTLTCLRIEDGTIPMTSSVCILERTNGFLRERFAMRYVEESDGKRQFEFLSTDPKWQHTLEVGIDGFSSDGIVKILGTVIFAYRLV